MSYTPHTWVDNETITASKLNALEQGVSNVVGGVDAVIWFPDSTQGWQVEGDFASALEKVQDGKPIICISYESTIVSGTFMRMISAYLRDFSYDSEEAQNQIIIYETSYSGWIWTSNGVEYFYND